MPNHINHDNGFQSNVVTLSELRWDGGTFTLSGDTEVGAFWPPVLILDADGAARNITLPADAKNGQVFFILNESAGAFALSVRQPDGTTVISSVAQDARAAYHFFNGVWRQLV